MIIETVAKTFSELEIVRYICTANGQGLDNLKRLLDSGDDDVFFILWTNRETFDLEIWNMLEHPNCPKKILEEAVETEKRYLISVAENPNCPEHLLRKMAEIPVRSDRLNHIPAAYEHKNTPEKVKENLKKNRIDDLWTNSAVCD